MFGVGVGGVNLGKVACDEGGMGRRDSWKKEVSLPYLQTGWGCQNLPPER